jgi:hypothetical protein
MAYNLFNFMATQWRMGPSGPGGLDYQVLYKKMDRLALTPEQYDELEADIQIMECAAINEMRKK